MLAIFLPDLSNQSLFVELKLIDPELINKALLKGSFKYFSLRIVLGLPVFALVNLLFLEKRTLLSRRCS